MAIFQGEEMVPVVTPDGRTITVPRSLSGMAPSPMQVPGVTPVPEPAPVVPPVQVPDMFADRVPAEAPPTGVVEMGEPDVVPVIDMQPEVVTANPQRVQKARTQAAAPQGQLGAASTQRDNAARAQVDAVTSMTDVDTATNDLVHGALVERNAALAKAENDRNMEMLAREQEQEKKMNEVIGLRKKIEGTKIDRTADHPIMAALGIALAGLGSAMKGDGNNPALDLYFKMIDRKVAAQEADLDRMGKVYGMTKDEIGMLKEKSKNRLEFHNAMIAGEINKSIRTIEEMTARSASEKTKANGKMMIAELQARAADKTMEATRWGLEYDQRDKAEKNQNSRFYSDLGFRKTQHADSMQIRREEIAADMAKALANTKATGSVEEYKLQLEAAKESRQFGVRGMDAEFYLSPQGRAKMEEAKQLEAKAAELEANPDVMARSIASDKIRMMREKAAVMRGQAQTFDTIKAHNETEAVAISNAISSGQSVVQLIDEIKQIYDDVGRSGLSRDAQALELRSKFNLLLPGLKDAWQLGAWDRGADNLAGKIIGQDPSSEWNVGVIGAIMQKKMLEDPEGFKKGLDAVATDLENKTRNKLVGIGAKFGKDEPVLRRSAAPEVSDSAAKLSGTHSGLELAKDTELRVRSDAGVEGVRRSSGAWGQFKLDQQVKAAENASAGAQSIRNPGLAAGQDAPFEERLQAYKQGDQRAGDELVALVAKAAQSGKADKALPLLRNLRDHAPKLHAAARAALPKGGEADEQMKYEENMQIAPAVRPPAILFQEVLGSIKADGSLGDVPGMTEIIKLSTNPGPYQELAKKAYLEITSQMGHNKTLPRGSIFNKGAR